jgi:hypothetical protein
MLRIRRQKKKFVCQYRDFWFSCSLQYRLHVKSGIPWLFCAEIDFVDLLYLPRFLILNHLRCLPLTTGADSSSFFLLGAHTSIATGQAEAPQPYQSSRALKQLWHHKKAFSDWLHCIGTWPFSLLTTRTWLHHLHISFWQEDHCFPTSSQANCAKWNGIKFLVISKRQKTLIIIYVQRNFVLIKPKHLALFIVPSTITSIFPWQLSSPHRSISLVTIGCFLQCSWNVQHQESVNTYALILSLFLY